MSDELNLPDDLRLTDDLAACEARLAGYVFAPSRLNRDELLYQAGWAACEAKLAQSAPTLGVSKGGIPTHWSAAFAALAATLAVAVTLALRPPAVPPMAAHDDVSKTPHVAETPARAIDEPVPPSRSAPDPLLAQLDAFVAQSKRADRVPRGGLLAMSSLRMPDRGGEALFAVTDANASASLPMPPATSSQLLDELLPASARRGAAAEHSTNDVLRFLNPLSWDEDAI